MQPEYIIDPTHTGNNLVVDFIYPLPEREGSNPEPLYEIPDVASHYDFTEYAYSRFDPRDPGSEDTILRTPVGQSFRHRWRRGEGWMFGISPKISAGVLLATTAIANLAGNYPSLKADTGEAVQGVLLNGKEWVHEWLGHEEPTTTTETVVPGGTIELSLDSPNPVGESAPQPSDIAGIISELQKAKERGATVTGVTVYGSASDEWGADGDSSLQLPNPENVDLANNRAIAVANELQEQAETAGVDLPEVSMQSAEDILSSDDVAAMRLVASQHNLTIGDAIRLYNQGAELPQNLESLLQAKLGDARSVRVNIRVQEPDQIVAETVPVEPATPENKDHDYGLYWGVPLPFFPRFRREPYLKTQYTTWKRPGAKPDERWVELYKEALQEDGSLPRDAWRFTRKYQLLAREDRIDYVLTHTYKDAGGEERTMRVMFVDHDPTDETVAMFQQLLTDFSQMNDGKIAKRWSAITVFPDTQVGTDTTAGREGQDYPHHPSDIGLGIDKQDPVGVLGTATPALGLIEMHMPEGSSEQDLRKFMGGAWTAGHELSHAADTNGNATRLVPVGPPEFRHYVSTSTWADAAQQQGFDQLPDADAGGPRELTVRWQAATPGGEIVDMQNDVAVGPGESSTFINMSHPTTTLNGRKPTSYSSESGAELFGEAGAQVVSGIPIPFSEAGIAVDPVHPELGRGYSVGPELRDMFEQHTGWSREAARPVNPDEFALMLATDDPVLRQFIDTARRTPMPEDRITILSRVIV
jgi:hypothetical protein